MSKLRAMRLDMHRRLFTSNPYKSKLIDNSTDAFEIGYIAGLIDGEGSVGKNKLIQLKLHISHVNGRL